MVVVHDPHGRVVPERVAPCPPANVGWADIMQRNAHLNITPQTIQCWDGERFDYGLCIDWIVRSDEAAGP